MLEIKEDDYNSLWAELQWPGEKFEKVMCYFRKYAGLEEGLSSRKLTKLLLDLGKSCYTVRGGIKSLTERGDLCWIMSGSDMLSGSQFMCLAGLMDNSTPHSTSSPTGLLRLELIFMYYDRGNKGYWDKSDWEILMRDIQYPSKNGEKLVPYPLQCDQFINFEILKRLVDTRRLRGTSQLLRISFDLNDINDKPRERSEDIDVNLNKMQHIDIDNCFEDMDSKNDVINSQNSLEVGNLSRKNNSFANIPNIQVFSPTRKVPSKRSPINKKRQYIINQDEHDVKTTSPQLLTSRDDNMDNKVKSNIYIEGISSYMSKIPVISNSPNPNIASGMTFRGSVISNHFIPNNGGMLFGCGNPSIIPAVPTQVQIPMQTPIYMMNSFQNVPSQISNQLYSESPTIHTPSPVKESNSHNNISNFNAFHNIGQSLQNVGQSLMSMIPKVFSVPNITINAGNYSYASHLDLQKNLNKNSDFNHSSESNMISDELNEKKYRGSLINNKSEFYRNTAFPNFHSTYSNDNYPMSIDLSKLGVTVLPSIPENKSNFSEIEDKQNENERDISLNEYNKIDSNLNDDNDKSDSSEIKISNKFQKLPIRIEEIDYFFTFMEQFLYNEIVDSSNLFDRVLERHESSFQLTEKEQKFFGSIMKIKTMDQLLLTFALNCIISHQYSDNSFSQNQGVLGSGVSIDEVHIKIDKLIDLFHRIYRIMYQDLKSEVQRNENLEQIEKFSIYDHLPYVVKMVWEKVKVALGDDIDAPETIKDICIVYYHYILETNDLFSQSLQEKGIRYHPIDEMIEIVRQRYVVAMKMLSLNNSAKNKDFRNINNEVSEVSKEDIENETLVPYTFTGTFSPKYPLLTATSSPNYSVRKKDVQASEKVIARRKPISNYEDSNLNAVPRLIEESAEIENTCTQHSNRNIVNSFCDYKTQNSSIDSFNKNKPSRLGNKVPANFASYCPTEHILTDKVPDARLERKSRIPSKIL